MERNIIEIEINKIAPHPHNPRHNVGDVTELANSIKVDGIWQNLTVVPYDSEYFHNDNNWEYMAVIGHRRLAASRQAGLKKVPCLVATLTYEEQIRTMMVENMQRTDLTIIEQAQGFQMMIDLGDTIDVISEKCGFSESTVRKRVKLLELNQKDFISATERGGTLQDYDDILKIKDKSKQKELLKEVGTANFDWSLKRELEKQARADARENFISRLKEYANKTIFDSNIHKVVCTLYNLNDFLSYKLPDDILNGQYEYNAEDEWVKIYKRKNQKEIDQTSKEKETAAQEKELRIQKAQFFESVSFRAFEKRFDFIKNFRVSKGNEKSVIYFITQCFIANETRYINTNIKQLQDFGLLEKEQSLKFENISESFDKSPLKTALMLAYFSIGDKASENYHIYDFSYRENKDLDLLYDILEFIGYEYSDEEEQWKYGTHEMYLGNENINEFFEDLEDLDDLDLVEVE